MKNLVITTVKKDKDTISAIQELKNQEYVKEISLATKKLEDFNIKLESEKIKTDLSKTIKDGAVMGTILGGATGGLGTLFAGVSSLTVPGAGLIVGPIALTLAGALTGAAVVSLAGVLVDLGVPEKRAERYASDIKIGHNLLAITTDENTEDKVKKILERNNSEEVFVTKTEEYTMA